MDFRERRVSTQDDLSLYVRDYGNPLDPRAPLLCLGGLSRNSKDFADFASRISADGRRVVAPDYRGRGRSDYDADWRNYDPRVYLRDIHDILTALDIHRVVVIGTSLGGILSMGLGAAAPTMLAGVVMNDVGPEIETEGLTHIVAYLREDRPQPDWESAVKTIRTMFPNLTFQDDGTWMKMAQNTFREGADGRLHFDWDINIIKPSLQPGYHLPDLWPLFRSLDGTPLLLLRGENSDILSRDCFRRMQEARTDMIAIEVPGAGHVPTLSEPESRDAIDEFLARH